MFCTMDVPEHSRKLHNTLRNASPSQSILFPELHLLFCNFKPLPHVELQADESIHSLHTIKCNLNFFPNTKVRLITIAIIIVIKTLFLRNCIVILITCALIAITFSLILNFFLKLSTARIMFYTSIVAFQFLPFFFPSFRFCFFGST